VWVKCDRTTSEMCKHTHKHTIPNIKFNLKLLQIKCHVLVFTTDKAQNVLQRIIGVFVEAFVSHDRHTLFTLEESEPPQTTYTYESQ
jgi:threonyl-tRNA synthetase